MAIHKTDGNIIRIHPDSRPSERFPHAEAVHIILFEGSAEQFIQYRLTDEWKCLGPCLVIGGLIFFKQGNIYIQWQS